MLSGPRHHWNSKYIAMIADDGNSAGKQWRHEGNGRGDRPGWHPPRGDTRLKIIFVAEFRKNVLDKRRGKMGVVSRRQLKRSSLSEAMTKKVVRFFQEKIGWHPSVAAPGDTNPSDATAGKASVHTNIIIDHPSGVVASYINFEGVCLSDSVCMHIAYV